jgi:hypothetical protein
VLGSASATGVNSVPATRHTSSFAGSTTGATKKSLRAYRGAAADSSPLAACSRNKQAK